jgi:hypothetical protein
MMVLSTARAEEDGDGMMLQTISRKTADNFNVTIENGALSHGGGTFTRHAPLTTMADVLELAEAVSLFDRAEMPSLAAAAAKLAKRGPLSLWSLVEEAARLSYRAGTRPADMPRPRRMVRLAGPAEPGDVALRTAGFIPAVRIGPRVLMEE